MKYSFQEIDLNDMPSLSVGHAQNEEAGTGVTVLYFPDGARVGCDISGGGPASRETPLCSPVTAPNPMNAVVLSGGSAYGLAAADGVMRCLESHGIGYDTGFAKVPLVAQSCLFDLSYKSATVRPDAEMGMRACEAALNKTSRVHHGNVGAATGATVGKLKGMEHAEKTGLGTFAVRIGEVYMAAIVAVNALGDIVDPGTGNIVCGMRDENGFMDCRKGLLELMRPTDLYAQNTTIGAVITNADFTKAELTKLASMTRNAYARCICPVGTLADGDSIYAASVGTVRADLNMAGTLAAYVMEQAILRAANRGE